MAKVTTTEFGKHELGIKEFAVVGTYSQELADSSYYTALSITEPQREYFSAYVEDVSLTGTTETQEKTGYHAKCNSGASYKKTSYDLKLQMRQNKNPMMTGAYFFQDYTTNLDAAYTSVVDEPVTVDFAVGEGEYVGIVTNQNFADYLAPNMVVKDTPGGTVLVHGTDYWITRSAGHSAIKTIPTGAISKDQTVYVDYDYKRGEICFNVNGWQVSPKFTFFVENNLEGITMDQQDKLNTNILYDATIDGVPEFLYKSCETEDVNAAPYELTINSDNVKIGLKQR